MLSAISIRGLGPVVERKLRERAREPEQSLNSAVKELIEDGLAPSYSNRRRARNREMFADLFGTWTDEQAAEFERSVAEFGRVENRSG